MPFNEPLAQRIQSSLRRIAEIRDFSCLDEGDKTVLRGQVTDRDEALMCAIVARTIPGVHAIVSELRVTK